MGDDVGTISSEPIPIIPGLNVLAVDRHQAGVSCRRVADQAFEVRFQFVGEACLRNGEQQILRCPPATVSSVLFPSANPSTVWMSGPGSSRFVSISCNAALLSELSAIDLPYAARWFDGRRDLPIVASRALVARTDGALADLFHIRGKGRLSRFIANAKAIELLRTYLREFQDLRESSVASVSLSRRDIERLQEARACLAREIENPPTIEQLSRRVALNQRKLKAGFKHLFRQTIFDFSFEQRMKEAHRLLCQTDRSIDQVAASVGYEYATSFTAAFKRYAGHPPRACRGKDRRRTMQHERSGE